MGRCLVEYFGLVCSPDTSPGSMLIWDVHKQIHPPVADLLTLARQGHPLSYFLAEGLIHLTCQLL